MIRDKAQHINQCLINWDSVDVTEEKNFLFGNLNICTATASNIVVVAQRNYITVFSDLQNHNHGTKMMSFPNGEDSLLCYISNNDNNKNDSNNCNT